MHYNRSMIKARVQRRDGRDRNCGVSAGFTMIEMMVIVVMFGIMISIMVVGYPLLRNREKFMGAEQQIQSVVRSAQQMAIQEDRDIDCVAVAELDPGDPEECKRRCSDIGVAFEGGEIVTFADLDLSGEWEASGVGDCGGDIELNRQALPEGVTASEDKAFVFLGVPPTVTMKVNGELEESGLVTIYVGDDELDLTVWRYGHVSRD